MLAAFSLQALLLGADRREVGAAHEDEEDHEHHDRREGQQHVQLTVTVGELRLSEQHVPEATSTADPPSQRADPRGSPGGQSA